MVKRIEYLNNHSASSNLVKKDYKYPGGAFPKGGQDYNIKFTLMCMDIFSKGGTGGPYLLDYLEIKMSGQSILVKTFRL